jgi:hypothetical protein
VTSPPTGSRSSGRIVTEPRPPQICPVHRMLVQRKRVPAKQRSRMASAAGSSWRVV